MLPKIRWDKRMQLRLIILGLTLFALVLVAILSSRDRIREEGKIRITLPPIKEGLEINLYFTSGDASYLVPEERRLEGTPNTLEGAKLALEELIKGPIEKGLIPTIPEGTKLRELYIASGVAYPDFSHEIVKNHGGGTSGEVHTVYSIVNTLGLNFEGIRNVQILVEGREIPTLAGHLDTSRPLGTDMSLIKEVGSKE